jgi:hypothetical protein
VEEATEPSVTFATARTPEAQWKRCTTYPSGPGDAKRHGQDEVSYRLPQGDNDDLGASRASDFLVCDKPAGGQSRG